jgi:hypothetical protein
VATPGSSRADAAEAVRAWLVGDAEMALGALKRQAPSRERDFNQGVVELYQGDGETAERLFNALRSRHSGWLPAARWLARAQERLGRVQAIDSASVLLKMPGALGRDYLWAARLFAERNDPQRARDCLRRAVAVEPDLYDAWTALGDVEQALGRADEARAARERAGGLYPAGLPTEMKPPPPLSPGRPLRYQGKYLVIPLGSVTLTDTELLDAPGGPARRVTLEAKSRLANMFMHINSRFESIIGADGALIAHHNTSDDSATGSRQSTVETVSDSGAMMVRETADGLFSYDIVRSVASARTHDGLSMIGAARAVARSKGSVSLLRIVNSSWKGTRIRTLKAERIGWRGLKVDTILVEIAVTSPSAAGVVGTLQLWISADESTIPYRVKMGTGFGSVTLELMREEGAEGH